MDLATIWVPVSLVAIAAASLVSTTVTARQANRLTKETHRRDELAARRDVLRRVFGYRYRLTPERQGQDGEPFIALNEALLVYADFPEVTKAVVRILKKEDFMEGDSNIVELVRAMGRAADLPIENLDKDLIITPLVPVPRTNTDPL